MNMKKIIGLLVIAFVIFFIVRFPTEASSMIKTGVSGISWTATKLADFVRSLT